MTITVDRRTALRAVLMLFGALAEDGTPAGDIDRVEIKLPCSEGTGERIECLYQRPTRHGRPVVSKSAAALMCRPLGPDPNL